MLAAPLLCKKTQILKKEKGFEVYLMIWRKPFKMIWLKQKTDMMVTQEHSNVQCSRTRSWRESVAFRAPSGRPKGKQYLQM